MNGQLDAPAALALSNEPKNSLAKKEGGHQTWSTKEAEERRGEKSQLCWKLKLSSTPRLILDILLHAYFPRSHLNGILDLLGAPHQNSLHIFCFFHPSYMCYPDMHKTPFSSPN
jgi:hypothetical protein